MSTPQAQWSRVSRTALGVARVRAGESARDDALFDDPYASSFVDALADVTAVSALATGPPTPLASALAFHIVIRTRFYDDLLLDACAGGCRQVVLLAAGLDTRAHRLRWPEGVRLYELDLPDVVAFKEAVLTERGAIPRCARSTLGVDLRDDWGGRLLAAGFTPTDPTAWLAEGLFVYFTATEAADLLSAITRLSAPGSRVAFERGSAAAAMRHLDSAPPEPDPVAALWQGGLGDGVADWLTARGWAVRLSDLAAVADGYRRPAPGPTRSGFVSASYG